VAAESRARRIYRAGARISPFFGGPEIDVLVLGQAGGVGLLVGVHPVQHGGAGGHEDAVQAAGAGRIQLAEQVLQALPFPRQLGQAAGGGLHVERGLPRAGRDYHGLQVFHGGRREPESQHGRAKQGDVLKRLLTAQ